MNSKMLLAFAGGLIVASGVTYIAMKRTTPLPVETAQQAQTPVAAAPATGQPAPGMAEPAAPEPAETPESPSRKERFKPAPVPERTQRAAVRIPPSSAVTPASAPAQNPPVAPAQTVAPTPTPAPAAEPERRETPPAYQPPSLPPPEPHTVTIPSGTLVAVRLGETLSSERNQPGDQFSGVLDKPLVVDGFVIAEKGSRVRGRIVELERAGKVRGVAKLAIELTQLKTADGQNVRVNTSAFSKQAETTRNKDAVKVGAGAAIGAAIGAIAGGGKGAAIGAGVGGAAGAGDVAMTRGETAELRVETLVSFRLSEAVTVTERLQ